MMLRVCCTLLALFVSQNLACDTLNYGPGDIEPDTFLCLCEGEDVVAECPEGKVIKWKSAEYKTLEKSTNRCFPESTISPRQCQTKDSLKSVQRFCDLRQECKYSVNDTFFEGDPCYEVFNDFHLKVTYRCTEGLSANPKTTFICETNNQPVTCPSGNIDIASAAFETDETNVDPCGRGKPDAESVHCSKDVTVPVSNLCDGKQICTFPRLNESFGDPCADTFKSYFEFEYSCETTDDLGYLSTVNITDKNVAEVAAQLEQATQREDGIFMDEDLQIVGDILEKIVDVGDGSGQVLQSVVDTVSNILYVPGTKSPSTSQPPSNSTTRITLAMEDQVSLGLQQNETVHAVAPNLAAQGFRVNSSVLQDETFDGRGFGILTDLNIDLSHNSTRKLYKTSDIVQYAPQGYIFLSNETVKAWSAKTSYLSFVFLAYRNDYLFPSVHANKTGRKVEGFILTANVTGDVPLNVDSLSHPVIIQNTIDSEGRESHLFPKPDCVYWDYDVNTNEWDWSSKGCTYVEDVIEEGRIVCSCTHLTNFAVLVYHGKKIIDSKALDIISKIGCYISLVALIVTVITLILVRRFKQRNSRGKTGQNDMGHNAHYFMILMCITLSAVYVVFLAAIDRTVPVSGCTVAAALLHYLVLATMVSTVVQARYMYIKLVTWQKYPSGREPNLVLKATAVTFGIPAIIVAVSLVVDHRRTGFKAYNNEHYCFPKVGWIVYFAVLLPIAIVLIHNLISAGWIIKKAIFQPRVPGTRAGGNDSEKYELILRLRQSVAISCLLGLSWIFGFFAIDEATLIFQWLFTIFNSLQGLLIFIFFCLTSRDVRATIITSAPCSSCINYINIASLWTETSNISQSNTGKDRDTVSIDNIEMSKPQSS